MMLFRYERRTQPVLTWPLFVRRMLNSLGIGAGLVAFSMAIGMLGYHCLEDLSWLDSYVNAAMILSGMGPLHDPKTPWGKIFAGTYALYSGFAVLVIAGIAFAPIAHRLLHRFHAADTAEVK
jgi:hypothetical protein